MISLRCPKCAARLTANDELADREIRCPRCGQRVIVPDSTEEPEPVDDYDDLDSVIRRRKRSNGKKSFIIVGLVAGFLAMAGVVVYKTVKRVKEVQEVASTQRSSDEANRHFESRLSFVPPDGWVPSGFPGMKYKVVSGPRQTEFVANINLLDQAWDGTLDSYVDFNVAQLEALSRDSNPVLVPVAPVGEERKSGSQNFRMKSRIISRAGLTTDSGLIGRKMVCENQINGKDLRQTYYFFQNGGSVFVVTFSVTSEEGAKFGSLFDASMKTFRFEK